MKDPWFSKASTPIQCLLGSLILSVAMSQLALAQEESAQADAASGETALEAPKADTPLDDASSGVFNFRMTLDDLEATIATLDENYERRGNTIGFSFAEANITVVADPTADRMRILTPILPAEQLSEALLVRLMQANFDSALDARYAIAQGLLWSTFIHPLSPLTEQQFLSGIGQTINTAQSFGTTFSSGEVVFGGGDSSELQQRQLIDELLEKGQTL